MVLTSALRFWGDKEGKGKPHIITSNLEHDSVAKCLERLEKDGQAGNWIPTVPSHLQS